MELRRVRRRARRRADVRQVRGPLRQAQERVPLRRYVVVGGEPAVGVVTVEGVGWAPVEVLGVEGVAGWLRTLFDRWDDDPEVREVVLYAARAVESEPSLLGASAHLLMVARRRMA